MPSSTTFKIARLAQWAKESMKIKTVEKKTTAQWWSKTTTWTNLTLAAVESNKIYIGCPWNKGHIKDWKLESEFYKPFGTLQMTTVQIAVGNFNTKTRLFKYIENFTSKKLKIFRKKKKKTLIIFIFLLKNIDCGYSLEPPRRGGSNEYPQSMFLAEIRKMIYIPL